MSETDRESAEQSEPNGDSTEQCAAITESGERCQRSVAGGKFCHQHDESDPTIDQRDSGADGADDDRDTGDGSEAELDSLAEVKRTAAAVTNELIEGPLDGVVEVSAGDSGWLVVVEVVERRSIPDTQDILGRYEIDLDGSGSVTGYRRVSRYRRIDTDRQETFE